MAGVCLIKIRGDGVKVVRGGILGGLQRPGRDGGAERLLQSLLTPGPASECPLGGGDPWEAQPQAALRAQETGGDRTHLRHISPVSVMLGCQILVKHFTLGGCNTEGRDHRRARAFCAPHPAPFYHTPGLSGSSPRPCSSVCTPRTALVSLGGCCPRTGPLHTPGLMADGAGRWASAPCPSWCPGCEGAATEAWGRSSAPPDPAVNQEPLDSLMLRG